MQNHHSESSKSSDLFTLQEQIIDALNCGVLAYTLSDHNVIVVNDTLKRMYGIGGADDNTLGRAVIMSIIPEDAGAVREMTERLKKPGDSVNYIYHIKRPDGVVPTLKAFTSRQAFEDGREYILSVIENISREEELRVSLSHERQLYRDVLTRGVECCFNFDATDGTILQPVIINDIDIVEKLGLSFPAEYEELGRRFFDEYDVRITSGDVDECFSCEGLQKLYDAGTYSVEAECYMVKRDTYFSVLIAMSKDEKIGHLYALFIARDTTEAHYREELRRKELEQTREELAIANFELQETLHFEQEKSKIINAISNVYVNIFHIDFEKDMYREVSGLNILGKDYQHLPSAQESFRNLIVAKVAPAYCDAAEQFVSFDTIQERMRGKKTISLEYQTSDGNWMRSSIIEGKRNDDGTLSEVLFATERIDEIKRKELLQQEALRDAYDAANRANEAKTNFLASMSHDIRTPMNAIIGMTAIAGTHLDDKDRVADCLTKITTSSKHLLGLINEVLDMNKIESGKLDLAVEEFNLSDLIDNLLTMVRPHVEARQHELKVNIRNVEHEQVIGDSQRIQQVFMNIMGNAIKYTPSHGKIALTISEKHTNRRRIGCYEFVFEDNGIGMKEEFIPHIFEAFSRAKDEAVESMQGTGLGMAITNNIVQMMNGDIKVESEIGVGSKFTVTIFLELQEENEADGLDKFADLPVLVVDDDQVSCETTCEVLCSLGMNGEWVTTGIEAIERVVTRHEAGDDYMAVVIDWKMPVMDGLETTREIRKKLGTGIPIIIISAYDWSDIEAQARAAGVNAFLSKPVFKSRVVRAFKSVLYGEQEANADFDLSDFSHEDYSGRRALLVEDNEINSEIAGEVLGMTGLQVEFAYNGKEAVDLIADAEDDYYDIVFMDIQMPIMNGYEATRAIRSMPRDYAKRVPILAVTANAFAEDIQDAMNAGMNEHIAKPLNFESLLNALNRWLD